MKICSGNTYQHHEEVVYESRDCPLCYALEELDKQTKKVEELQEEIANRR